MLLLLCLKLSVLFPPLVFSLHSPSISLQPSCHETFQGSLLLSSDPVYVHDHPLGQKWLPGTIERCLSHRTLEVSLLRHIDLIRIRTNEVEQGQSDDWLTDFLSMITSPCDISGATVARPALPSLSPTRGAC